MWPLWVWVSRGWVDQLSPFLAGTCVVGAPLRADHSSPVTPVTRWGSRGAWENQNETQRLQPLLPCHSAEWKWLQFWVLSDLSGAHHLSPFFKLKALLIFFTFFRTLISYPLSLLQRVVPRFIVILVSLYCAWYVAFDFHRMGLWLFLYFIKTLPQEKALTKCSSGLSQSEPFFRRIYGKLDRQQGACTSTVLWYRVGPKWLQNSIDQFLNEWCEDLRIQLPAGGGRRGGSAPSSGALPVGALREDPWPPSSSRHWGQVICWGLFWDFREMPSCLLPWATLIWYLHLKTKRA